MPQRPPSLGFESPEEMKLPLGRTCEDCRRVRRCKVHLGIVGNETACDYNPSRYSPAPRTLSAAIDERFTQRDRMAARRPEPEDDE